MPSILNATTTSGLVTSADNSGSLQLQTNNGTTAVTIDTSQNVGIGNTPSGTSATGYRSLELGTTAGTGITAGNGDFYIPVNAYVAGGAWKYATTSTASLLNIQGGLFTWSNAGSGTAGNNISFSERMRITSGGELYVGTTTGTIDQSNFGFVVAGGELSISRNVGASSPSFNAYGTQGLARVMGDGDLENTNARYTGISDIKFKQNIVDATSQWNDIKAIKVRKYELIANPDRQHIGCVAQELEQVCPGLVIEREDDKGETYKSVAYSILYMKAVKALQEAMERIEKLETEVQALKGVA